MATDSVCTVELHPNRYAAGCRCDSCRTLHRDRQRAYYQRIGGNKNRKPHHKQSENPKWDAKRKASMARTAGTEDRHSHRSR